jgi:hypothetical protein
VTKILIRSATEKQWKAVQSADYKDEAHLQTLLASSPALIPVEEIIEGASPLLVAVTELGLPGSGNTDLLAFNSEGAVILVECKLATNSEIKRKVVGQILEYGAYLWGMSYEELDRRISPKTGKSLLELVRSTPEGSDIDEEEFRSGVKESLERGTLNLIIAVDDINAELSRTINFLNGCGKPAFTFHALEMKQFTEGMTEVLMPYVHGPTLPPTIPTKRWTEETFLQQLQDRQSSDSFALVQDLYEWSKQVADQVIFGVGKENGTFTFYYLSNSGRRISVFTVYTTGIIMLNYGTLTGQVERGELSQFHLSIRAFPGSAA